jgi:hypothetical protein
MLCQSGVMVRKLQLLLLCYWPGGEQHHLGKGSLSESSASNLGIDPPRGNSARPQRQAKATHSPASRKGSLTHTQR